MTTQMNPKKKEVILCEIIENAAELPLENQNLLLMLAKSMKYTRDCMVMKERTMAPPSREGSY